MINKAILLGRVGRVKTSNLPSGAEVTNITLATNKTWKNKDGERQDKTVWHNVSMYGKISDIGKSYLHVGDLVYIEGEFDSNKYTTKEGVEKLHMFIMATQIKLMPKNTSSASKPEQDAQESQAVSAWDGELNDEIPF
jgi:single-strand DNA-binding protein